MTEATLTNLELTVENLLDSCSGLKTSHKQLEDENISLRNRLSKLTQERAQLVDKNNIASNQIKRIITQLRSDI